MTPQQTASQPNQPLPGARLTAFGPIGWRKGTPMPETHRLLSDLPMAAKYAETIATGDGGYSSRGLGWGAAGTGDEVRRFLGSCLTHLPCSEASVQEDGTIHYRQSRRHSVVTFTPDTESGVIITDPASQVTADAYRVTGHDRTPQVWSAAGVRRAVADATRPGPIDWPDGWALLMPDATIRFAPRGFPWSAAPVYVGEPVPAPETWGPSCAQCGRFESEHDPKRAWAGCWTFQPPAD
ncbi:hypothetical protein [Kitasatospora sp. NPDC086791]|uniref:hypothetical protein n=1 Tax=Kitasatospora sp. NPDC086791 TaxID=3155178 RepID=UPI0034384846